MKYALGIHGDLRAIWEHRTELVSRRYPITSYAEFNLLFTLKKESGQLPGAGDNWGKSEAGKVFTAWTIRYEPLLKSA